MKQLLLKAAAVGDTLHGFFLTKKEFVPSARATLYTLRHEKTGAELLYFDRRDENKTFAIGFKTLPEDDTGVFHILEHSVLNGSRRFPVKEPFVSMLQSSMQTFLNAMTYSDKTLYPISSRNEQDFRNLMEVYLDAVFCPLIYERPEIFMQEGWHYEFEEDKPQPYYNGVVFSEMKGAYADVDSIMDDGINRLLFPDNSYGYSSGGFPAHIPDLTYEKFLETHSRFYHPSNARIFLDGQMEIDSVLSFMDETYLSHYDRRVCDFDFVLQVPETGQCTVFYEAKAEEEALCHMTAAKILCSHEDVETLYGAKILADYLTGSNEAPLKRAFLEEKLGQNISLSASGGLFQPTISIVVHNTTPEQFPRIRAFLSDCSRKLAAEGLDREALLASLEHYAFSCREKSEPYGIELAIRAFNGWLYGDDPLTHIHTAPIFDALRRKMDTDFFEKLLLSMLADPEDKCYLYAHPSLTKGQEDAQQEAERIASITAQWDDTQWNRTREAFASMQQWQQNPDSEAALATLPHLRLKDIPREVQPIDTAVQALAGQTALKVNTDTNGISYLNLFFDISDFTTEELRLLTILTFCFGELATCHYSAPQLQTKIKATLGTLSAKLTLLSETGDLQHCTPYLVVSASMLDENISPALALLEELLLFGKYDQVTKINESIQQDDYYLKQVMISNGHSFAMTRALSASSAEGALRELLGGESFAVWHTALAGRFLEDGAKICEALQALAQRAFVRNRLFLGYSGAMEQDAAQGLIQALPTGEIGITATHPTFDTAASAIEIPASVGFSALGHNLYAMGAHYTGAYAVLSSYITYSYLWNMVRVQGGAYGTGMSVRANGEIFCYSYRDPNLSGTRDAFSGMADYLEQVLEQGIALDDIIIGTVNTTDPLLDPAGICNLACIRFLKGTSPERIAQTRHEILDTTPETLRALLPLLRTYTQRGKFCAVGEREAASLAANR